jgi:hypothetical protein
VSPTRPWAVQVLVLVMSKFLRPTHSLAVACRSVLSTSSVLLQNEVAQVHSQLTALLGEK